VIKASGIHGRGRLIVWGRNDPNYGVHVRHYI
jgi:hypothetical protein